MMNRIISAVKKNDGQIISGQYQNRRTKFKFKCKAGHIWETQVQTVLHGSWCFQCWKENDAGKQVKNLNGLELAQAIAKERGGECLSTEYKNGKAPMIWRCSNGHEWKAPYHDVRRRTWCPQCGLGIRERWCRHVFEELTSHLFPKSRPKWLINSRGNQMELDGYCSSLAIAFEHNGLHHYQKLSHFQRREESLERRKKDDVIKNALCKKNNIRLIVIPYSVHINEIPKFIRDSLLESMTSQSVKNYKLIDKSKYIPSTPLIELQIIAQKKGGACLSKFYQGIFHKLKFRCAKGHEWEAIPSSIKSGDSWCPECKPDRIGNSNRKHSLATMNELAKKNNGQFLSSEFKSVNHKYKWRCEEGHEWLIPPTDIMKGHWCRICSMKKLRGTILEMKRIAKKRGGDCLSNEYLGSSDKLHWLCANGHTWFATPNNVKNNNSWCPKCSRQENNKWKNQK